MRNACEKPCEEEERCRSELAELDRDDLDLPFDRPAPRRRRSYDRLDEEQRVPIGLSVQWPLIRLGRSFRNMAQAYRRFFSVSEGDLKGIYERKALKAAQVADHQRRMLYMEKVVALDPDDVDAIYALGLAYEKNREFELAHKCYRKVARLAEDHAKAHFRCGLLLMRRKAFDRAIEAFNRALEHEPKSAELNFRLGQAHDRQQEHEKAIEFFSKAVEIDGEYLPAYKHMALTYDSMNKHRKALDCLKRALELEEMSA
jgi:tetratricopeptide (TPR) repeat protein